MSGKGHKYLEHNLNQIVSQNYKNFEVIISDQSQDNKIKILCKKYKEKINKKYFLIRSRKN
jgi:cellulose synthase/poly-beta-1,6-N-acetylglucosamine synthase-like glycosyltransferase